MDTPIQKQREALRMEMLEAEAQRAELRRAFVVDGIKADFKVRVELDARIARLTVELHKFNILEREEKQRVKTINRMHFSSILAEKLTSNGMGKMIEEARAESLAMLEAAGLLEAYQARSN